MFFFSHIKQFVNTPAKIVLTTGACVIVILFLVPFSTAERLTEEGGVVENGSIVALGLALALALWSLVRRPGWAWLAGSAACLWMILRELDFQKRFTPRSIESIGFYSNPANPLEMKLVVIAALLPFIIAGIYLLRLGLRHLPKAWRVGEMWTGYAALGFSLVGIAFVFEKLLHEDRNAVEEVNEVMFACFVFLMVKHFAFKPPEEPKPVATKTEPEVSTIEVK